LRINKLRHICFHVLLLLLLLLLPQGERRPGFVGLPLPGVEVKVVQSSSSSSSSGGGGASAASNGDASKKGESRIAPFNRCTTMASDLSSEQACVVALWRDNGTACIQLWRKTGQQGCGECCFSLMSLATASHWLIPWR
jgi:hypothetical protein